MAALVSWRSAAEKWSGLRRNAGKSISASPAAEKSGQEQGPTLLSGPSLRGAQDALQLTADPSDCPGDNISFFVEKAELYGSLASTLHLSGHSLYESRTTSVGLAVVFFVLEADESVPPVVEQADEVYHESTGLSFCVV